MSSDDWFGMFVLPGTPAKRTPDFAWLSPAPSPVGIILCGSAFVPAVAMPPVRDCSVALMAL